MIPSSIFSMWLRALMSVVIIVGSGYLLHDWYQQSAVSMPQPRVIDREALSSPGQVQSAPPRREDAEFKPDLGMNSETAELVGGCVLLLLASLGAPITKAYYAITLRKGDNDPKPARNGKIRRIERPDGSVINVEFYGSPASQPIIFSHGWGASSEEWYYVKTELSRKYQVIVWDIPGTGLSKKPANNDFNLEKLATDLHSLLPFTGNQPVILAGHSIGGMITLTLCRLFPELLGNKVKGLVLAHTTYTNPLHTTKHSTIDTTLQPLLVPLLYLTIALWPLVWLMNWLSYLNGSTHRSTHRDSFAGTETRGQLDFITSFVLSSRPDIMCYGMFGMLKYDAQAILSSIKIPVLIVDGDKDTTTIPEASEKIKNDIVDGRLETLAPAKHMGLIEHHQRFNQLIDSFASTLPVTASAVLAVNETQQNI